MIEDIPIEDGNDIPSIPTPHEFEIGFHNAVEMKAVNDILLNVHEAINISRNILYVIIKTHPGRIIEFQHWLDCITESGIQIEHILNDIQAVANESVENTPSWFTDMVNYEYKQRIDPEDDLEDA